MDHADVREILEVAAAEPGVGGVAGHEPVDAARLGGCSDCTEELDSLRRTAAILRDVVPAEAPVDLPPELRERT